MAPIDTLADLAGWWLELRCGCGRAVQIPVKLLARDWPPSTRLPDLVVRMRCSACGARPVAAEMLEDPQRSARGFVGGGPVRRRPLPLPP